MPDLPERPNLLLLLPDQHRADWLAGGGLPLRTPTLARLAARGVSFTRAYCTAPLCAPSRASLAAGRHYAHCGVPGNGHDYPLRQPTFYQALRAAGYRVAGVGKFDLHKDISDPATLWWELDGSRLLAEWGFTDGIDSEGKLDGSRSYRAAGGPRGPYLKMLHERGLAQRYVQEHAARREHLGGYVTALPDDAYGDNWVAGHALRVLRELPRAAPWFLQVNFLGPHDPFDVTAAMRARWERVQFPLPHANEHPDRAALLRARQNYAAMIENIDSWCGRLLDAVAARGELRNTIVVYASDHGEMLGDHGRWGKSTWREAAVRVPLLAAGPGCAQGAVSNALVSLHDLAATFLDYAAAAPPPAMDAVSLRPLLEGRRRRHRPVAVAGMAGWRMATDERYKLVLDPAHPPLLFDRSADPLEERDLAAARPEVADHLRLHLV